MGAQFLASLAKGISQNLLDGWLTLTEAKRRDRCTAAHEKVRS